MTACPPLLLLHWDRNGSAVAPEVLALGHEFSCTPSAAFIRLLHPSAEQRNLAKGAEGIVCVESGPPNVEGLAVLGSAERLGDFVKELASLKPMPLSSEATWRILRGESPASSPLLPQWRPAIMGILNVTPDSFSDGGCYSDPGLAVERGLELARQGADIIDIGAESTRPGAPPVSAAEERRRIMPVVEELLNKIDLPLSVDTRKPEIAREALGLGCQIINDVGGLREPGMAEAAAEHDAIVICMHMAVKPETMQNQPHYHDLFGEIALFFGRALERAGQAGLPRQKIWLDPGIGFGKSASHNFRLIRELSAFSALGRPLVVGASRKSFLAPLAGQPDHGRPQERLIPSVVVACAAASRGAGLLRVHDVEETKQALDTLRAIDKHEMP